MTRITRHYVNVPLADGQHRRVHYRQAGSGPPLLMIHQSPRNSGEYAALMERWAAHFTCIAPDTPVSASPIRCQVSPTSTILPMR